MLKKFRHTESETKLLREQGYRLIKQIGQGAYAQVFLGEFIKGPGDSLRLACKIVHTSKPSNYDLKCLPREVKILLAIKHPNIVHVYSIFQRKSSYFIFMRFAERGDLFEYVKVYGPVKEYQTRVWVRQIALALQYLHTLDIAHRDLKCENILVTTHLNLKLTDFGFARNVRNEFGQTELSDTFCGSKQYTAPEILLCTKYDPKAADLWSFGVVIYSMLNKALPFNHSEKRQLIEAQMTRDWRFRRRIAESISNEAKRLVVGLLDPEPASRTNIIGVVKSNWIGMDPNLQKLSKAESTALYSALELAKSTGNRPSSQAAMVRGALPAKKPLRRHSKDVVYWKHMQTGLEVDTSRLNKFEDVV